jgi:prevent-host-death family protein
MAAGDSVVPAPSSSLEAGEVIEVKASVFKDTCLSLLDQVHDLEVEVVVTKHGVPVARLVPEANRVPSAFGFMRGTVLAQEDIVSPDFDAWGDLG